MRPANHAATRAALWACLALVLQARLAPAQRCVDCADADTMHHTVVHPAVGLRIGEPQQASIAAGVLVGSRWQSGGSDHARDVAVFVEPGLSGGRASLAYVGYRRGGFGSGGAVALSALRTWRNPWGVDPNVTYVGPELFVWPIVFVGPRVGLLRSVSSHAPNRWLISFDLGVGF